MSFVIDIDEYAEGAILLDGLEEAIIGIVEEFGTGRRILYSKPKILSTFPFIGRKVPEYNRETLRELIETPYRIVYELDETKGKI
jgi:hypothetical protein